MSRVTSGSNVAGPDDPAPAAAARGVRQRRSRERRERLLQATIELLADGGPRAVTHRAVSAQAGLPASSAGYYFATVDELLEQALISYAARRMAVLDRVLDEAARGASGIAEISARTAQALVAYAEPEGIAEYEVYLEAARNPALRDAVARSMQEFEDGAARRLALLGIDEPASAARAFVAVLNGFALNRLAMPEAARNDAELLQKVFVGMYVAFVRGEDVLLDEIAERREERGR